MALEEGGSGPRCSTSKRDVTGSASKSRATRLIAVRPGIGQRDGLQVAHAAHQLKRPVGHQAHAQAVVDHAAHGIQARDLDALAQGRPLRQRLRAWARLMLLLACRPTMSQSRTSSKLMALRLVRRVVRSGATSTRWSAR